MNVEQRSHAPGEHATAVCVVFIEWTDRELIFVHTLCAALLQVSICICHEHRGCPQGSPHPVHISGGPCPQVAHMLSRGNLSLLWCVGWERPNVGRSPRF